MHVKQRYKIKQYDRLTDKMTVIQWECKITIAEYEDTQATLKALIFSIFSEADFI